LIAFGTGGSRRTYKVIESTDNGSDCNLSLDRPLEVAVANAAAAFPGPYGSFDWAFDWDALALVTRPLATPPANRGVDSACLVSDPVARKGRDAGCASADSPNPSKHGSLVVFSIASLS
jgi:hypothetical protein